MSGTAAVGTGTSITFGTTAHSQPLLSVSGPSTSRESIQTSDMSTTAWHTFIQADLTDGGEVTLEFEYNGDDTIWTLMVAAPEVVTIDVAGEGAGDILTFTAFATSGAPEIPFEDKMTASITLKLTGAPTIA